MLRFTAPACVAALAACSATPAPDRASPPPGRRAFPGFSLAVPAGRPIANVSSYVSGQYKVELTEPGVHAISVRWGPGTIDADELEVTIEQYKQEGTEATGTYLAGPAGIQVPTVITPDDAGVLWLSALQCGTRTIFAETEGKDVAARHQALVASFVCSSDPAREPVPGTVRLALDLPNFFSRPDGRFAGALNITDGVAINIVLSESPAGSAFSPTQDLWGTTDIVLEKPIRGRIPYTGVEDGRAVRGFIVDKECVAFRATINAYAYVELADRLAAVVEPIERARCLDEGQPPPTWPELHEP